MQSVEAEDLFETIIHRLHPCRILPVLYFYTCHVVNIYSIPESSVSSMSIDSVLFPLSRPFTYSYALHFSVAFRIGS